MPEGMTLDEFLKKLKSLLEKGWTAYINEYYSIRLKNDAVHGEYCPITAVVKGETGDYYHPWNYDDACKEISLTMALARDIAYASDENKKSSSEIRERLLTILGLTEYLA